MVSTTTRSKNNQTTPASLTSAAAESTRVSNVTEPLTTEAGTTTNFTTSPRSTDFTTSDSVHITENQTHGGAPGGAIAGGVIGGIILIALIVLAALFLYRRRNKQRRRRSKTPLAPGKDELDTLDKKRCQNQYVEPQSGNGRIYTNVDERGTVKESTDPALDSQGYLKSKSKEKREKKKPKKEPHYVNKDNQIVYENEKIDGNGQDGNEQEYYFEVQNDNDISKVPVFKGKDNYLDLSENQTDERSVSKEKDASTTKKQDTKSNNKSDRKKHTKHKANKNESDQTDSHLNDEIVKTQTNANSGYISDEEYEIPDPSNYPKPKKSDTASYANDKNIQTSNSNTSHLTVDKVEKGNKDKTKKQKPAIRESQYENIKSAQSNEKYANDDLPDEPIEDELYENA